MDESKHNDLVLSWSRALREAGGIAPSGQDLDQLLRWLVDDLARALSLENFDADAGARAGAALANLQLASQDVVAISAPILWSLIDTDTDIEAGHRISALLAKFGEGFGTRRQLLFAQREQLDDKARKSDERFRVVFDNAEVAIAIGDTNGVLLDANQLLSDMIGVPTGDLRGISVYDFAHPEDRERIRGLVYERLVPNRGGTVKLEQQIGRADGSYGWASFSITFVEGSDGHPNYLLAVGEDVTEQYRMREELHRQARHDPLTGLANRRHLLERLDEAIHEAGFGDRIGLCFVDLDRFKSINDRYGHGAGDRVLAAVAGRLGKSVQGLGCLVARIGGDEFVTLVPPPVNDDKMAMVANRLLGALADPVSTGQHELHVSASIGAVITAVGNGEAEELLDAADSGLYHAKQNGKAQWVLHTLGDEPNPESGPGNQYALPPEARFDDP